MKEPLQIYGVKTSEIEKNSGISGDLGISTSLGLGRVEFSSILLIGIGFEECL